MSSEVELENVGTAARTSSPEAGRERALLLADIISDTPARDTVVLDIHELSPFADYFVITAGANERQLRAINRIVAERMADAGIRPQRVEGAATSGWIVLDFGDVPVIDSTAAHVLKGFVRKLKRSGTRVYFSGTRPRIRDALMGAGLDPSAVEYVDDIRAVRIAEQRPAA